MLLVYIYFGRHPRGVVYCSRLFNLLAWVLNRWPRRTVPEQVFWFTSSLSLVAWLLLPVQRRPITCAIQFVANDSPPLLSHVGATVVRKKSERHLLAICSIISGRICFLEFAGGKGGARNGGVNDSWNLFWARLFRVPLLCAGILWESFNVPTSRCGTADNPNRMPEYVRLLKI